MCLAIPGRIVAVGPEPHLATVDVCGVRRRVNIDLLPAEGVGIDDWVLIHVGFAMSRISDAEAREQLRVLRMIGEDAQAMEELEGYGFA
jgi:hydrogenase expression/formation protein HypC